MAAAQGAFAGAATAVMTYAAADRPGQPLTLSVALPVVVTKLLLPAPVLDNARFYDAWRTLTRVDAVLVVGWGLAEWPALFGALRLPVLPGVDPNPANLFTAGALLDALVIARLESDARNPAQFRVTVAAQDPNLANAVLAVITAQAATP